MTASTSLKATCDGCQKQFPSKNKLFQHLAVNSDGCLSPDEYNEYLRNPRHFEKIAVLYGYLPGTDYRRSKIPDGACGIEGGQHAAWMVTEAIDRVCRGKDSESNVDMASWSADKAAAFKINRSYGTLSRNSNAAEQDEYTGAITEMLVTNTSPLFFDFANADKDDNEEQHKEKVTAWVNSVNQQLDCMISCFKSSCKDWSPGRIRVFGRLSIPQKKFNPETDVVHRRVDYCFPADLLYVPKVSNDHLSMSDTAVQLQTKTLQEFLDKMPSFPPGVPARVFDASDTSTTRKNEDDYQEAPLGREFRPSVRPDDTTLTYLFKMKKVMQAFTTQVEDVNPNDSGAVLEKKFSEMKRNKQKEQPRKKKQRKQAQQNSKTDNNEEETGSTKALTKRFLRRKRFHNFSNRVLAHDFLSYRRLDRIYHRATLRLNSAYEDKTCPESDQQLVQNRPFVVFSQTGDIFLYEQARRVIALLIAILRGCIDIEILDCIFDEEVSLLLCTYVLLSHLLHFNLTSSLFQYAHLVSAPLAPSL
jgi:tRNA U38,U39,U40 pseudouridine synthase TruA